MTVKRIDNSLKIIEGLKQIQNATISVGWYPDQKHGDLSSPFLARILHNGASLKGGQPYFIDDKGDIHFLRKDSALGQKAIKAANGGGSKVKTPQNGKESKIKGLGITKPSKIPPRPFFDIATAKYKDKWVNEDVKGIADGVVKGKLKIDKALPMLGEAIKADVYEVMGNAENFTPNSPMTARRKGKNTPLIDTNQLREQIEVRKLKK